MEELLEMFLTGTFRLPAFEPALLSLDQALPKLDLLALLMLQRRGEATMSELAGDLGAPLSTATGIGTRLERRGLIRRERHEADRRVIMLQLTPKGQELASGARAQVDQLLAKVHAALTPEELTQLLGLVQKVLLALQPSPASGAKPALRRIPIEE